MEAESLFGTDTTDLLRSVSIIDGPLSERMGLAPDGDLDVGDNVIVISFEGETGSDTVIHLRRGMDRETVARSFEAAAKAIRLSD